MERRICYIESLIKLAGFSKLGGGKLSVILPKNHAKNYPKTTQETTPKTTREMPEKTSKSPQKHRKELLKTLEKTENISLENACKVFICNILVLSSSRCVNGPGVLGFLKWENYPDKKRL
jgi:hypothetical protein